MIQLAAPSFGAAGLFLAAPYTLDFSKDLNYVIPIEGTWQGDRKKGRSLYIDNYANNISITVSSGNYSIRIPAYTSAYIDLSGFNDVFISADGVGSVPNSARLSTESKQTEMISRGNSPATIAPIVSLNVGGPINLSGYTPQLLAHCATPVGTNSFLTLYAFSSTKVIKINTTKNAVFGSVNISKAANCICEYGSKILFGTTDGYLGVYNCLNDTVNYYYSGYANAIVDIAVCNNVIAVCNTTTVVTIFNSSFSVSQYVTFGQTVVTVTCDNSYFYFGCGDTNSAIDLYAMAYNGSSQAYSGLVNFQGGYTKLTKIRYNFIAGNLYLSSAVAGATATCGVNFGSFSQFTGMGYLTYSMNPAANTVGTKNNYLLDQNGVVYVFDPILNGLYATLAASKFPGGISSNFAGVPELGLTYIGGPSGIYYIND